MIIIARLKKQVKLVTWIVRMIKKKIKKYIKAKGKDKEYYLNEYNPLPGNCAGWSTCGGEDY
ncbi:MAG: hypothetical protein ACC651_05085 [Candidatus Scalindua sp.]